MKCANCGNDNPATLWMKETQFTAQCVLTERGKPTLKTILFNVHTATA